MKDTKIQRQIMRRSLKRGERDNAPYQGWSKNIENFKM